MDMEEKLDLWTAIICLHFDSLAMWIPNPDQEAFAQVKDIQKNYPVSEDEGRRG